MHKLLSRAGVASRRRAEMLIRAGRIRVNGRLVTRPGVKVDPARDVV
ncbi:S4 domain-containing protein, partial [Thermodesulfitimonas autotrophica]